MTAIPAVLLPIGPELYAVPAGWVSEVAAAPDVTALVTATSLVLGLFNLRGEIVPLLDTAALLGVGTAGAVAYAVVLRTPQGLAGLAATGLPLQVSLDDPIGPSDLPGTSGTFRVAQNVAVLLDPAVLLTSQRLGGRESAVPSEVG